MYTLSILVKAFLKSKEETVNLISLIIHTHLHTFSTASSFYLIIYIHPILYQKPVYSNYFYPFLTIQNTILLYSWLFLKLEGQHQGHPTQLKIFLHSPNNTASNALDWVLVHPHTSLPYSNDGLRIDNITCRLR